MTEPVKPTDQRTPEQIEADTFLASQGLEPGPIIQDEGAQPMPTGEPTEPPKPAEPAVPAVSVAPAAPVPAPPAPAGVSISAEELASLRSKADHHDREKTRADGFRDEADRRQAEIDRLRLAVGVPIQPTPAKKREYTEEEQKGINWLTGVLPELLPELIAKLPEEALAKHPVMMRVYHALGTTRDEIDQSRFLSIFDPKDRSLVAARVLPALKQRRSALGYSKSYEELWDYQRNAIKEAAQLYGIAVTGEAPAPSAPATLVAPAPASPAAPAIPPVAPTTVPPSVLRVPGASSAPTPSGSRPLDIETLRTMGLADGPFNG